MGKPTVTHAEHVGFPLGTRERFGFVGTRKLVIAWDDLNDYLEQVLRFPGELWPYDTATGARAETARFEGVGKMGGTDAIATYEEAHVTVIYKTPGPNTPISAGASGLAGGFSAVKISESFEPSSDSIPMDHTKFKWKSTGEALEPDEAPGRIIAGWRYKFEVHNATFLTNAAQDLTDKVNDGFLTVRLADQTFQKETLYFEGLFASRATEVGRRRGGRNISDVFRLQFNFFWRPETWNRFYRSSTGTFDEIVDLEDNDVKAFKSGNFRQLTFG